MPSTPRSVFLWPYFRRCAMFSLSVLPASTSYLSGSSSHWPGLCSGMLIAQLAVYLLSAQPAKRYFVLLLLPDTLGFGAVNRPVRCGVGPRENRAKRGSRYLTEREGRVISSFPHSHPDPTSLLFAHSDLPSASSFLCLSSVSLHD